MALGLSPAVGQSPDDEDTWSVTISWIAPGDDGDIGIAAEYDIRYHESKGAMESWILAHRADGEPRPLIAGTPQTYVLTGLKFGQGYWIALKARDEAYNWSPMSNAVRIDPLPPGDALIDLD